MLLPGGSADQLLETSGPPASSLSTALEQSRGHVPVEWRNLCVGEETKVAGAERQRQDDPLGGA